MTNQKPNLSNFRFVEDILLDLREVGFAISQKSLEKIIRKRDISSFVIDGQLCVNYEDYLGKLDIIQNDLATKYSMARKNIQKGQLRSNAIIRGVFRTLIKSTTTATQVDPFLKSIKEEFANRELELGSPPKTTKEFKTYLGDLLKKYDAKVGKTTQEETVEDLEAQAAIKAQAAAQAASRVTKERQGAGKKNKFAIGTIMEGKESTQDPESEPEADNEDQQLDS